MTIIKAITSTETRNIPDKIKNTFNITPVIQNTMIGESLSTERFFIFLRRRLDFIDKILEFVRNYKLD